MVYIEDEVEYENDFLYEDPLEREQQQGEFWEYQRVVAKESIDRYVRDRKSVTVGNREVQKTWTHVESIEGEEPQDYTNIGVVGFNFNYKHDSKQNGKKKRINFMDLLIHLWPGDWRKHLSKLNIEIGKENETRVSTKLCLDLF